MEEMNRVTAVEIKYEFNVDTAGVLVTIRECRERQNKWTVWDCQEHSDMRTVRTWISTFKSAVLMMDPSVTISEVVTFVG